jgi:hypothetical protein
MQSRTKLQKLLIGNVQSNFKNQVIRLLSPPPPLNDTFFATSLGSDDYKTLFFVYIIIVIVVTVFPHATVGTQSKYLFSLTTSNFQSKCFVSSF